MKRGILHQCTSTKAVTFTNTVTVGYCFSKCHFAHQNCFLSGCRPKWSTQKSGSEKIRDDCVTLLCLHSSVLWNEHSAMEKLWVCATKGYSTKHTKGKRRYSTKAVCVVLLCWPQGRMCCHVPCKGVWRDQSILPAECHERLGFPVVQP